MLGAVSVHTMVLHKSLLTSSLQGVTQPSVLPVGVAKIRKPRGPVVAGTESRDLAASPPGDRGSERGRRGGRHRRR